ncbi:MAG TPA: SigE family RNA polymerase sigma factor [Streptosporangiaceae bacterium]|jgi:RNA polymerase sigma-70 factor (sigma-E family)
MESDAAVQPGQAARTGGQPAAPSPAADVAVSALYQAHALGLIRLAYVMLGDTAAAEDVVQEAFTGLYRRWAQLSDPAKALPYVRSSVLNACRSQLRHLSRRPPGVEQALPPAVSAEAAALSGEDRRAVMRALRRLPARQREVLVLRYYLDLPEQEIATAMGIGPSTVRSTTHRALAALGRMLEEES